MLKDWVEVELGDVCDKARKVKRKEVSPDESLIYLDISGIDNKTNQIIEHKIYTWADAPSRAQQIVKREDILFSTVRTYLKNIAQVTRQEYNNQICSSGFTVIRGKENILTAKYAFYLSIYEGFLQPLNELQTGSSYPAVRDSDVFKQIIPLAPLPEQRAIASKIEQLFSELDNGIATLKTAKSKLEIYRQAILKQAFEGNLTKDWRKKQPKNHGNHVNQKNHSADNLPATWKWAKLGEVIEKPKYGTSKKCTYNTDGVGVLRIPNINDGRINDSDLKYAPFTSEEIITYTLQEGDLLTIRSNGSVDLVGKCALISKSDEKYLYAGYLIRLRPKKFIIQSKYLLYCLTSHALRIQIESKAKSTSGVNNINSGELESLLFPLPLNLAEQTQIVQEIETRLSVCDKLNEAIEQSLEKAQALRQSILKKAFEGKLLSEDELQTCRQQPDWENAAKLLERIKNKKNK